MLLPLAYTFWGLARARTGLTAKSPCEAARSLRGPTEGGSAARRGAPSNGRRRRRRPQGRTRRSRRTRRDRARPPAALRIQGALRGKLPRSKGSAETTGSGAGEGFPHPGLHWPPRTTHAPAGQAQRGFSAPPESPMGGITASRDQEPPKPRPSVSHRPGGDSWACGAQRPHRPGTPPSSQATPPRQARSACSGPLLREA